MRINSPEELAHHLKRDLRLPLTARPWNIHRPADTLWWLVPSTEWPAYQHGKLLFSMAKDVPRKHLLGVNDAVLHVDEIFAGLNIEKGYGKNAVVVDPTLRRRPAQIMDGTWCWRSVVEGQGREHFARALTAASHESPFSIYVISTHVHDRDSPVHREWDALLFGCGSSGIKAVSNNGFPVGVLRATSTVDSFEALAEALGKVDEFHWVDLYVGVHVAKGELDLTGWYQRTLSHFDPWVGVASARP
jgi:hypothetical protein